MVKRKISDTKFNPKKTKYIDIIYSECDSDPDSVEDPEWLPDSSSESSESSDSSESEED